MSRQFGVGPDHGEFGVHEAEPEEDLAGPAPAHASRTRGPSRAARQAGRGGVLRPGHRHRALDPHPSVRRADDARPARDDPHAAVTSGTAVAGEPWQHYDLGHGYCTYTFFEQCPHRMACAPAAISTRPRRPARPSSCRRRTTSSACGPQSLSPTKNKPPSTTARSHSIGSWNALRTSPRRPVPPRVSCCRSSQCGGTATLAGEFDVRRHPVGHEAVGYSSSLIWLEENSPSAWMLAEELREPRR